MKPTQAPRWLTGPAPGLIGELVRLHGVYYVGGLGWSPVFEALCAEQLGEISRHFGTRDDVTAFSAWDGDHFLAGVVMDARPCERPGARLRFLIASDAARGRGLGHALLERAIAWSERRGDPAVWLTTVAGLDASSHLYRKFGFRILEERIDRTWGDEHREQLWERLHLRDGSLRQQEPQA
jgi:GNAT superfamily N-acetyltransferase